MVSPARTAGSRLRSVRTVKVLLLVAAFLSFLLSVFLFFIDGERSEGIFVGLWVPSILSLGTLVLVGEDAR